MVEFRFKISDEAFKLLLKMNNDGYAEYCDTIYETIDAFIEASEVKYEYMTLESFKARNCGGTYYLIEELLDYNLVCDVVYAWHTTYKISDIGKELISNVIRKLKLQKLKEI